MLPNQAQRVIAHVDLDAFYTQVEVQRNPSLKGLPVVTMQYNPFGDLRTVTPDEPRIFNDSNGSLIAVSYEARAFGVKRGMRGDQARKVCPEVQLVQVPTAHGKADLTLYRDAGKLVVDILSRIAVCERASIDECYLDLTEEAHTRLAACSGQPTLPVNPDRVHVCGQEGDDAVADWWKRSPEQWQAGELLLACGAAAVADLRAAVAAELGYSCSAGVAHNKILAKLASGMHKPSQQTLVPLAAIPGLLQDLPIPKLRQLGGKFGDELMTSLSIKTVGELAGVSLQCLESQVSDITAQWLYRLARGCDTEEVKQRTLPKSISCGKTFRNHTALHTIDEVHHWLQELGQELEERVIEDRKANARLPQLLTVSIYTSSLAGPGTKQGAGAAGQGQGQAPWQGSNNVSRSCQLRKATAGCMADDATALVKKWTAGQKGWSIVSMFLAVASFAAAPTGSSLITKFFKQPPAVKSVATAAAAEPMSTAAGPESDQKLAAEIVTSYQRPQIEVFQSDSGLHAVAPVSHQWLQAAAPSLGPGLQATAPFLNEGLQAATQVPDTAEKGQLGFGMLLQPPIASNQGLQAAAAAQIANESGPGQQSPDLCQQTPALHAGQQSATADCSIASLQQPSGLSALQAGPTDLHRPWMQIAQPPALHPVAAEAGGEEDNTQRPAQSRAEDTQTAPNSCGLPGQGGEQGGDRQTVPVEQSSGALMRQGAASKGLGKRLLGQSFDREPEHRKRTTRMPESGVDAPLYVNFSKDSIDESVLSELPATMQREIRLSMMAQRPASKPGQSQIAGRSGMHRFLKPQN